MISIRNSISEIEKSEGIRVLTLDCYLSAIKNAAAYVIEFDDQVTRTHREHMSALVREVAAGTSTALSESCATLRALLRDYRDKGAAYLARLRADMNQTAGALQRITEAMSQTDGDHETRLRKSVQALRDLSRNVTLDIGPVLAAAADTIEQELDEFRRQHQLTVSQFVAEINLLHKRIDALEAAASVADLTKLLDPAEMEAQLRSAAAGSLLLLKAQGLQRAEAQFGRAVAEELMGAVFKRLRNSLTHAAIIGRWSEWAEEQFLTWVPAQKNEAVKLAKSITERLSGSYSCLLAGKAVRPSIQLNVTVLEFAPGEDAARALENVRNFFKK